MPALLRPSRGRPKRPPSPGATAAPAEVTQLRAELEAARRRVDELARGIQEVMRDREDFKQRLHRERERMIEVEKGHVAQALIEAIDELDLSSPPTTGRRSRRASG